MARHSTPCRSLQGVGPTPARVYKRVECQGLLGDRARSSRGVERASQLPVEKRSEAVDRGFRASAKVWAVVLALASLLVALSLVL
jgi:hypothetical protein